MTLVLCSGPLCIEIQGVALEELSPFFASMFEVRDRNAGDNPCATVHVERITVESWEALRTKFLHRSTRRLVLYPSKKTAHHIEGIVVDPSDAEPVEILCPTCVISVEQEKRIIRLRTVETADCQPTLRVLVRDVMKRAWEQRGAVFMHGAAVLHNGRGIFITGPKGAGKTNLMLQFVRQGAQVLAFDRVMLVREQDELILYAWPTYLNIDRTTLVRHRSCFPEVPDVQDDQISQNDGKVSLIAEQVKSFGLVQRAKWTQTIFPKYQEGQSDWVAQLLPEAEAYTHLLDECLSAVAPEIEDWHGLIRVDHAQVYEQAQSLIAEMSASKGCWRWEYGESLPLRFTWRNLLNSR